LPGWYGWLDREGRVVRDFPVPLREPIMMHDMALTQSYALLLDVPLVFDPKVGGLPPSASVALLEGGPG
jgi:carotenoid cleavage dioxygenase